MPANTSRARKAGTGAPRARGERRLANTAKLLAIQELLIQTVSSGALVDVSNPGSPESTRMADDSRWFAEEVQSHDSSLRAYLRGTFPTVRDVDDVVQESYLRIWRARTGQPIRCGRGFLFRVARNVALNLLNRRRHSPIVAVKDLRCLDVVEDGPNAATTACAREELLLLARAIDSLPARCREIVILRRLKNVPQKEIAARLGIAEDTVEVQVARGVKRCGAYLRRHGVRFDHETRH